MIRDGFLGELQRARRPLIIGSLLRDDLLRGVRDPVRDLQGHDGCVELLNITRPDLVADHHRSLVDAGAEVLATNTVGAAQQILSKYRMKDESFAVSYLAAEIAVGVARAGPAHSGRPVTVLGEVWAPWRMPLSGFITCREVEDTVASISSGLASGGVDAIHLQTAHYPGHLAAAFAGVRAGLSEAGRWTPVLVSVRHDTLGWEPSRDEIRNDIMAAASLAYGLQAAAISVEAGDLGSDALVCLAKEVDGPLFVSTATPPSLAWAALSDSVISPRLRLVSAARAAEIWRLSRRPPTCIEHKETAPVTANDNLSELSERARSGAD